MDYSLISVVEDDTICQESSRLFPGVRNVLLASLSDAQKTWKRRNTFRQVGELIVSSVVEDDTMCIKSSKTFPRSHESPLNFLK